MTPGIRAALADATERLRAAGVPQPAREARLLLAHAQGRDGGQPDLDADVPKAFADVLARRAAREPMALITGRQGFWTLDLLVSRATLIPRPETETLIEALLLAVPDRRAALRVLDLGTGTGALLLAALSEYPTAFGVGLERNAAAAALARRNAARCGLADRAVFAAGDWAACLAGQRFDAVLANPPYIRDADIPTLMPEVTEHEPALALAGGADGLDAYRAIIPDLQRLLRPGGVAVLEVGQGQAADVAGLGAASGLGLAGIHADLAGIGRAVVFRNTPDRL